MNTNYDVLNYLNLTNPRLGKLYKLTGYNPLPENFVLDEDKIKERLNLSLFSQDLKIPEFVYEDKKFVKKYFKISLKNTKKLLKIIEKAKLDENFKNKFEFYLTARKEVTEAILKEFKNVRFDEGSAYEEICTIDPIFAEILSGIFDTSFSVSNVFINLEDNYQKSYLEKINALEEKNKKKQELIEQKTNNFLHNRNNQKTQSKTKNAQKTAKNTQKLEQNKVKNENSKKIKKENFVEISLENKSKNKEK